MSELWLAAQNSQRFTFVSVDEKEQQAHKSDRMAGSAVVRPKAKPSLTT